MNTDEIKIKLYTVKDLKDWICQGTDNGLSDQIIGRIRAYAIINNPSANDSDTCLAVAYIDQQVVGYTAMFAELFSKPELEDKYFWGTTLFVDSQQRGKGIGKKLMKAIKDSIDNKYLGLDSSDASVEIDKKLNSSIYYYNRYQLIFKRDDLVLSIKKIKYYIKRILLQAGNKEILRKTHSEEYNLEYVNYVDDSIYDFITSNSSQDLFLRKKETLNWILQYPFIISTPLVNRLDTKYAFFSAAKSFSLSAIKVLKNNVLVGFYIYKINDGNMSILYLYCTSEEKNTVYNSILEHLFTLDLSSICTFDLDLIEYCNLLGIKSLNKNINTYEVAFTVPVGFDFNHELKIQGGDGDMLI